MNRLQDRLQRLKKPTESKKQRVVSGEERYWQDCGAEVVENERGSYIRRVRKVDLKSQHGSYAFAEFIPCLYALRYLDADAAAASADQLLFFDTETTGLGMGTGNVPFMIGIGYLTESHFVTEQWLMRHPGEEPAMLHDWSLLLQRFSHLVSYNGKAFDWSILQNRMVLHRMQMTAGDYAVKHIDLLYPARSLWKNVLPSCRLSDVEKHRLSIHRHDDVPGALAPTLYFRYLDERQPALLSGVFEHNEIDILSLATLTIHLLKLLQGELDLTNMKPEEVHRLAVWLDRMQQYEQADKAWSFLCSLNGRRMSDFWDKAAARYKRRGDLDAAVELWHMCIEEHSSFHLQLQPYIELAMLLEHKRKDYAGALAYVEQARTKWMKSHELRTGNSKYGHELQLLDKRLRRLQQKLNLQKQRTSELGCYGTLF